MPLPTGGDIKDAGEGVSNLMATTERNKWAGTVIFFFAIAIVFIFLYVSSSKANTASWKEGYNSGMNDGKSICRKTDSDNVLLTAKLMSMEIKYDSLKETILQLREQTTYQQLIIKTKQP